MQARWVTGLRGYAKKSSVLTRPLSHAPERRPEADLRALDSMAAPEGDSRRHPRANVALSAELQHDGERVPVVIANLSRGGAMLKTSRLPHPSASVHLSRGPLGADAKVIWGCGNRCGVEFSKEIQVGEWVLPVSNTGQRRVDQVVALLKSGQATAEVPLGPIAPAPQLGVLQQVMDDLRIVLRLLGELKDDLKSSPDTVRRFSGELKRFERAQEVLAKGELGRLSQPQLVEELGVVFDLLTSIEDEITLCSETLSRHGYKMQHLDLAMQMLEEVAAGLVAGNFANSAESARLPRLRATCEHALSST